MSGVWWFDLCVLKFSWLKVIKIIKHKSALLFYQYSCFFKRQFLTDDEIINQHPLEIKWFWNIFCAHVLNLKRNPDTTDRFLISFQACSSVYSCYVLNFVHEFSCRTCCWLTKKPYCPCTNWVSNDESSLYWVLPDFKDIHVICSSLDIQ